MHGDQISQVRFIIHLGGPNISTKIEINNSGCPSISKYVDHWMRVMTLYYQLGHKASSVLRP